MEIKISPKFKQLFQLLEARKMVSQLSENDADFSYWDKLSKVDTVLSYGGRDCFVSNQKVITIDGAKEISKIKVGDKVLSYNESKQKEEYKVVSNTRKIEKKQTVRIKLKNGTFIECTPDHKFYSNGRWVEVKDLLSLWYGNMETDSKI